MITIAARKQKLKVGDIFMAYETIWYSKSEQGVKAQKTLYKLITRLWNNWHAYPVSQQIAKLV